jgi:hypothetical protein
MFLCFRSPEQGISEEILGRATDSGCIAPFDPGNRQQSRLNHPYAD